MHPGLVRVFGLAIPLMGWLATAIGGYYRGLKKLNTYEYLCPKCKNGNVVARNYGSFDQFEEGKCSTCGYKYDGFTEYYING